LVTTESPWRARRRSDE